MKLVPAIIESAEAASPPSRGRGLKRSSTTHRAMPSVVAPLAGAWIETALMRLSIAASIGRPPRGGVD